MYDINHINHLIATHFLGRTPPRDPCSIIGFTSVILRLDIDRGWRYTITKNPRLYDQDREFGFFTWRHKDGIEIEGKAHSNSKEVAGCLSVLDALGIEVT